MTTEKRPGTESLPLTVRDCYARSKARHSEPNSDCLLDTWEEQTQKLSRTFRRRYIESLPNAEALEAYLAEHIALAEARGAAEQRQKDLEKAGSVQALEARIKELEGEICAIRKRVTNAASNVMGIETEAMNGDNLATTLCSYFEDMTGQTDGNGWHSDAKKACTEVEVAIVAHMTAAIYEEGKHM